MTLADYEAAADESTSLVKEVLNTWLSLEYVCRARAGLSERDVCVARVRAFKRVARLVSKLRVVLARMSVLVDAVGGGEGKTYTAKDYAVYLRCEVVAPLAADLQLKRRLLSVLVSNVLCVTPYSIARDEYTLLLSLWHLRPHVARIDRKKLRAEAL